MKTLYLINNKPKEPEFAARFEEVAKAQGWDFKKISINTLAFFYSKKGHESGIWRKGAHLNLDESDFFFIRRSNPHGAATTLLAVVLRALGIPFTDAAQNLLNGVRTSKLTQPFELMEEGVPFPDTWIVTPRSFNENKEQILASCTFPLVMKMKGGLGKKVWKCETEQDLLDCIATQVGTEKNVLFLLQELVENTFDMRILVHKGEVLTTIKRASTDGFYNNISRGGTATAISATDEELDLARRAARGMQLDLAGVDVVRTADGPLVFEVNKAPDVTSFNEAAGFDLAERIAMRTLDTQ